MKLPTLKERDWFYSKMFLKAEKETYDYLEMKGLPFQHESRDCASTEFEGYSDQEVDYILSALKRPFHTLDLSEVFQRTLETCSSLEKEMTQPVDSVLNMEY